MVQVLGSLLSSNTINHYTQEKCSNMFLCLFNRSEEYMKVLKRLGVGQKCRRTIPQFYGFTFLNTQGLNIIQLLRYSVLDSYLLPTCSII